ncbi:hypothetical protein RSSM_00096 [Rhodopirellula sallentina SM41]|uniref:Uncharacterized protein n=2 Tax=Rhodopirellula TaxID=265488 RepID=M5UKT0_9BACT|nr:hypothetical protein RSSM_00096 [Rhodopirellula sallentina SM41]
MASQSDFSFAQAPPGSLQASELTSLAKSLIAREFVVVWPSQIEVGQATLSYDFPSIEKWDPGTSAHQSALAHEFVIQSIQRSRRPQEEQPFWDETFRQVRGEIQRILDDAARNGDGVDSKSHFHGTSWLATRLQNIDRIYDQRMRVLARQYGVVVVTETRMESFIVHLKCDPPNGTIRLIPAGYWELYRMRKRVDPKAVQPTWQVTQQGGVSLYGQNYVHVTWEDGRSFGPELVRFQINQHLKFTPSGPRQYRGQ